MCSMMAAAIQVSYWSLITAGCPCSFLTFNRVQSFDRVDSFCEKRVSAVKFYCCNLYQTFGGKAVTLEMVKREHDSNQSFRCSNVKASLGEVDIQLILEEAPLTDNFIYNEKDNRKSMLTVVIGCQCLSESQSIYSVEIFVNTKSDSGSKHLQAIGTQGVELLHRNDQLCHCNSTCMQAYLHSCLQRGCCIVAQSCALNGGYLPHRQVDLASPAYHMETALHFCSVQIVNLLPRQKRVCLTLWFTSADFRPCTCTGVVAPARSNIPVYLNGAVNVTTVSVEHNKLTVVPVLPQSLSSALFPPSSRKLSAKAVVLVGDITNEGTLRHASDNASLTSAWMMQLLCKWKQRAVDWAGSLVGDVSSLLLLVCALKALSVLTNALCGGCSEADACLCKRTTMCTFRQENLVHTIDEMTMNTHKKREAKMPMPVHFGVQKSPTVSSSWQRVLFLLILVLCSVAAEESLFHSKVRYRHSLSDIATVPGTLPISEWNALYDLYNATTGEDWRWSDDPIAGIPWNFSDPSVNNPCVDDWQGIKCSYNSSVEFYHIVNVTLPSYNLVGTLPDTMAALVELQHFDLSVNQLTGPISESLGNLIQLQHLELLANQFSGPIPESLGNLVHLQYLILSVNQLTGPLPESLGSLIQLQYLFLYDNQLTGPIPESLGNLVHLQSLDLSDNQLTEPIPKSLGSLIPLRNLILHDNQLTGPIPESLGNLVHLQYLILSVNQLTGPLPESLGNLIQLRDLFLYDNQLTGPIPESLGDLIQVQYCSLNDNQLTGPIPESLGSLTELIFLNMSDNKLTGPIPESLGNLVNLQDLSLYENKLTGLIPESLGNLVQLQSLDLFVNQLTGPIPESLGNLVQLQILYLFDNKLTGQISESLGNLVQLQYLYLNDNVFTGPIPVSLGNLVQLQYLDLYDNYFTGSIPESLGNLTDLQSLDLSGNHLTGPIPESLGNLGQLQYLSFFDNNFTGPIPESLGSLTELFFLDMSANQLTGPILESLGNLAQLQFLYLYDNQLTGPIPVSLGNLVQLQYLILVDNKLTGPIPESLGNLTHLQIFSVNANHLTGSIPSSLCVLDSLQYLDLGDNQLTGTIPNWSSESLRFLCLSNNNLWGTIPILSLLPNLLILQLQSNYFVGNVDGVFDPSVQGHMDMVVLNGNQLSGTLPDAIFQLGVKIFSAIDNCFEGPLPIDAICSNKNIEQFIVDGMSSATSCCNKLIFSTYTLQHAIGGSIPTCLFQLPNITTLHLSGNGFTGSIPIDIQFSTSLTDLSISHNALTGSIPERIQLKNWKYIDLSYNRLSGTLLPDFAANGSVYLENNRISGNFPSGSFRTLRNISVLGSNMFSCSYDESDLPQHNPNKQQYHCASNSFDSIYYTWLGATACALLMLAYCRWKYNMYKIRDTLSNTNLHMSLWTVCQLSIICMTYSVLILLPLYSVCSVHYGTQTYQYAYQVSAIFLSGAVPFALNWVFWFLLVLVVAIATKVLRVTMSREYSSRRSIPTTPVVSNWQKVVYMFFPYLCIDCIVVVGVNAAYMYVAVYRSSSLLLGVQTLLSIFKIVWGRWSLPYILALLTKQKKYGKVQVVAEIVVNVLNNIVIPCFVVAVVSPNCFYYALVNAPPIITTAAIAECTSFDTGTGQCAAYSYSYVPTSFDPPFSYNYQCSASLITYYAPAFVSMCIVSTFVTPLVHYMCQWLHRRTTDGTQSHRLLGRLLPKIMKSVDVDADGTYLNSSGLMTTLVGTLALILTFGVMFPPLCIALTVSLLATVYLFRVNVHSFIMSAPEQQRDFLVEILRTECNSVDSIHILKYSMWVLVTVSCWFYSLFLFDTLGDAVGFERAYWVLIVMPLMPLVMYLVYKVVCQYYAYLYGLTSNNLMEKDQHKEMEQGVGMEMQTLGASSDSVVHNVLVVGGETNDEEAVHIDK